MKQTLLTIVAAGLLIIGLVVGFKGGVGVQAGQPLPTPKGQLGGAPRLTPLIGGETTVTPVPVPATPTAEANGAGTATPGMCDAAPRSLDEVAAMIGATPWQGGPAAVQGVAADAATVAAVTHAVDGFVACLNEGDLLRALAFMTDGAVSQAIAATGWDAATAADQLRLLQPRPSAERIAIRAIGDVSLLPDGRVTAVVEFVDPSRFPVGVVTRYQVIMAPSGDRWLIDSMTALSA